MKSKKSVISLVLVLALFTAMLSACAPATSTTPSTPDGTTTGTSATEPAKDDWSDPGTWTKIVIFQNWGSQGLTYTDADTERVAENIASQTGTYIEAILPVVGAESDTLNTLLGSGEQINMFCGDWSSYYSKNALRKLNPDDFSVVAEKLDGFYPGWREIATDLEGNYWCIPQTNPQAGFPVQIRQDYLDTLGIPVPTTVEELEKALETIFASKDKLGADNLVTLLTFSDIGGLRMTFAGGWCENGAGNWISDDGKVMPVQLNPGYKSYIETMARWYEKGYIYSDAFSINVSEARTLVAQGQVAAYAGWHSGVNGAPTDDYKLLNSYTIISGLKGATGNCQTINGSLTSSRAASSLITASTTDKEYEAIVRLANWVYSDFTNYYSMFKGIPGTDFESKGTTDGVAGYSILNDTLNSQAAIAPFQILANYYMTTQSAFLAADGSVVPALAYNMNHIIKDIPDCKLPGDFEIKYDSQRIKDAVPNQSDISTMIAAEEVKFITGVRSMSEWDSYISELKAAGIEKLIDARTEQYKEQSAR